ncbi:MULTISPECIES: cyclodeaminase [Brucella]|jgi:ornithine cyclodeaminase|uniref:Cyclodeaminase n=1 Tax=Brucella anthropi TaxID=529 RepID=A0A6I0DLQ0_BRUAN|nr:MULTISPECIES: cyclodeaminase [Brucella/Ochrobactrum group]MCR5942016.1 cyclodeaminase [Ochrobactrum sp. XJ1]QTN05093.1 cyclodeaminase [Ochrobactrum sp. EEELCW01]KAB2740208.1 cyclodeaminase [Brucella anthropi]KAB2755713.1 cyclodeaminase [Brucella anthropi]KAB2767433.1 cyclodeaminase [Brucella anthropi]
MAEMRILTEADLRQIIALELESVACVEDAFRALASSGVSMPPILRLDIPAERGEVDVKTAYIPGIDSFAIKVSPGFFNNPSIGLPSTNGLMIQFSAKTGLIEALLLDNGYLTDVRTAAAGAVAAKYLARENARVATIIGAGMQAGMQLEALTLVRPITEARIWARNFDSAKKAAQNFTQKLGIPVTAIADAKEACDGTDIIVTTTPSETPLIKAEWLAPGQHVTAMGSDAEHKNEIDPTLFQRSIIYVADSLSQTRRLGELHHAISAGIVAADTVFPELGQIVLNAPTFQRKAEDITFCDLTGTGVQDTAIARLATERASLRDAGTKIDSTKTAGASR